MTRQQDHELTERGLGEHGLSAALDRASSLGPDEKLDRLIAVGEALWWLAALDDLHMKEHTRGAYLALRRSTEAGRTAGALAWARNLVGHDLAFVVGLVGVPMTWDGVPMTWGDEPMLWPDERWLARSELPQRGPDKEDPRDVWYDELVAEREVLPPLTDARAFLLSI